MLKGCFYCALILLLFIGIFAAWEVYSRPENASAGRISEDWDTSLIAIVTIAYPLLLFFFLIRSLFIARSKQIEFFIDGMKKYKSNPPDHITKFFIEEIARRNEELRNLNKIPIQPKFPTDATFLFDTFQKLLDNKVKRFKFILLKKKKFILKFSYANGELKITINNLAALAKAWVINEDELNSLMILGFRLNENKPGLH